MTRLLLTILTMLALPAAAQANVVINEVDYDQPSTDTAEFIELMNEGVQEEDLDGMTVELINGSNGTVYRTLTLPAVVLGAGDYFVICANPATTPECDYDWSPDTNLIQNGAPDALVLRDPFGIIMDALSYEGDAGAPYSEGGGFSGADPSSASHVGLSRYPDGSDTDDNDADFALKCITPGHANTINDTDCFDPVAGETVSWGMMKSMYDR